MMRGFWGMLPQESFSASDSATEAMFYYDSHTLCGIVYFTISDQPAEIRVMHERACTGALIFLAQTLVLQLPDLPDQLWCPW